MLLGLGVLVLGLTAACGTSGTSTESSTSSPSDASAVTRGGVLRYASLPSVSFDPAVIAAGPDYQYAAQVYDTLVDSSLEHEVKPALAESWDTKDGKTWTFNLRKDVKFSDGSTLTAADAIYSLSRLKDPKVGSNLLSTYENVKTMDAPDDYTVVITLKKVDAEFPAIAISPPQASIMPTELTDPKQKSIGTGPFMVTDRDPNVQTTLKANPYYWRTSEDGEKLPYLDEVDLVYQPEAAGQVSSLLGGQIDLVIGIGADLAPSVQNDPNVKSSSAETTSSRLP